MTAVPKPLKFLRPHYDELTEVYEKWSAGSVKVGFSFLVWSAWGLIIHRYNPGLLGRYAFRARNDLWR